MERGISVEFGARWANSDMTAESARLTRTEMRTMMGDYVIYWAGTGEAKGGKIGGKLDDLFCTSRNY